MLKIENLENYLKIKGFGDEKTLFLFYIFLNFYLNSNKKKISILLNLEFIMEEHQN